MALMKKKKDGPVAPASPEPGEATPKKGGKLGLLIAPVLVFGATFGASWVTHEPTTIQIIQAPEPSAATHSAEWVPPIPGYTKAMDPLTLTAGTRGQTLRLGIALELWIDDETIDEARLRDAFTTYLRALDPNQLADPSFHIRLKRALLHRARVVAGQDVVADVLITDFLLSR